MEIKKIGERSISIKTRDAHIIAYANNLKESKLNKLAPDITLLAEVDNCFSIVSPGEYETKEAWIMAIPSDLEKEENLDIFVINADEVRIAIFSSTVTKLTKKLVEKIGIIDVLIYDLNGDYKQKMDLIAEIDPQLVIPMNMKEEDVSQIAKELGVKNVSEEKKIKVKAENFSSDDYQLELVKLS